MKQLFLYLILLTIVAPLQAVHRPQFSTAGFFRLDGTGREVYSMNPAWRFYKGALPDASARDFDDSGWTAVSLPHGIEYLPTEASGCINYQGEVWYRKHFTPDASLKGKKIFLHFEAIMGKCQVWLNGRPVAEHYGGYLPVVADLTDAIDWNGDNVIAVRADNSDDPTYPPGKAQQVLDFTYFGGIYRDCWLVAHDPVHLTDPNFENETAGGGVFVSYDRVSEASADICLRAHVRNETDKTFRGLLEFEVLRSDGERVALHSEGIRIKPGRAVTGGDCLTLKNPELWSPDSPYLYYLDVYIRRPDGQVVDGYRRRIGIRSLEFKGADGFWLNGKPYGRPLIGANRHQDYAVVGNAVANSAHWRDAKKLRDAGLKVIRNAHCPQDPAFMDACDELGLFVIDNTPGWQFWNDAPVFAERVYSDIRNLVRRDRNHPCVWLWEPILNETWYPADFAANVDAIVREEYPYPSCYTACDDQARGKEVFPVLFTHPATGDAGWSIRELDPSKTYFTREWGDNVDNWSAHNSPSRVNRSWGEVPMLVQAQHYAHPPYTYTCYETLFRTTPQHVGGCLWHSFDHQRGYHPDPFYGGLMDVFRQPKYSYYLFQAQRDPQPSPGLIAETGPMVYIAHAMTPFSPADVTVYSNCDEVRLTVFNGGKQYVYKKDKSRGGMPSPVITFPGVYRFMDDKELSRQGKGADVWLLAEGLMDGKVVATHRVEPARRPEQIRLRLDNEGTELKADGSDFVTVVASVTDKRGNVKRLNNYYIRFRVEGEGRILGDASVLADPRPVIWGDAPVLVQATTRPGKIKIIASVWFEGSQMPLSGELEFSSVPADVPMVYAPDELTALDRQPAASPATGGTQAAGDAAREIERLQKELNALKLKEVERQQTDFGETR